MNYVAFPSQTIRVQLTGLKLLQTDGTYADVTSGATVTLNIVDQTTNVALVTGSVLNTGANWYADVTVPATPGFYDIRATAAKSGSLGEWVGTLHVKVFAS